MEKLISKWKQGWRLLYSDDPVSFYTFFTIIFAECSYFWAFQPAEFSVLFNVVLIGYVINVLLSALGKGLFKGTPAEVLFTILYIVTFIILFAMGCCINIFISIIITVIPFGITALWIRFREYQRNMLTYVKTDKAVDKLLLYLKKIKMPVDKSILKQTMYIMSQVIVIFLPFIIFAILLKFLPLVTQWIKNIALVGYVIFIPVMALLEEELSTYNIFEMAYIIAWRKEKKK